MSDGTSPVGAFPLSPSDFDAIIFDLGGVILPLDYEATLLGFERLFGASARGIFAASEQAELFDRNERGELTPEQFRRELSSLYLGNADALAPHALRDAFCALIGTIPDAHLRLLRELRGKKRTFLLSNTNPIHLEYFFARYEQTSLEKNGDFRRHFEALYFSNVIGRRKPEPESFYHVLRDAQLIPERTVFLDDNATNVRAARELGLLAFRHQANASLSPWFREVLPDFER